MTKAEATKKARRAANIADRHPDTAARLYDQSSTMFSGLGHHRRASEMREAADAYRQIARQRLMQRRVQA